VYAFKVGLLNVEYRAKIKHLGTLALIPVPKARAGFPEPKLREAERDLMWKAVITILDTLKSASHTGLVITLADGQHHRVYPRALSYVADDPEQRAVLQLLGGQTDLTCCRYVGCV
jgi:hypothetical protein